jgi:hypothetical protein
MGRGDDNIVWGMDCGGADCDDIVWGSMDGDNIVWGTAKDGDNIVWGMGKGGDNIVWGMSADDTWATDAGDEVNQLFSDGAGEPLPDQSLEFGDVVPVAPVTKIVTSILGGGL